MVNTNTIIKQIIGTPRQRGGKRDLDGDGILNKKDCQPRNTMRQDSSSLDLGNAMGALGFLSGGGGIFKGMAPISQTGKRATIINTVPKGGYGKGHEPAAKFASLSDGSKLSLSGPNKGKIF